MIRDRQDALRVIEEMAYFISKIDKEQIDSVKMFLNELRYEKSIQNKLDFNSLVQDSERNKIEVIGGLPFLLLSSKYFPNIDSIKMFATNQLHIPIPRGNKSRHELIGIIISEIAKFDPEQMNKLKAVIAKVLGKVEKGEVKDFFREWDKAIGALEFRD